MQLPRTYRTDPMYDTYPCNVRTPNATQCHATFAGIKACPWYCCWSSRKQSRRPACKHALLDGTNWTPLCRRAHIHARCMHTARCMEYSYSSIISTFCMGKISQVFHVFFSREHMTLKAKIMAGRPGRRAPYLQVRTGPYTYSSLVCFTPHPHR